MFTKWLVLLIIVAGVWYGFKAVSRRNVSQQVDEERRRREAVEDMTACSVCGTFVPQGQRNCGRDGCPYPPG